MAVYGDEFIAGALNALNTAVVSFKDTQTALVPTISYVYDRHSVAELRLNAASIELDAADGETRGVSSQSFVKWIGSFSIRIHTDYEGGVQDSKKVTELINSLANYLKERFALGSGYRIERLGDIVPKEDFEESASYGGSFVVDITFHSEYTQV